jgi:hypothetical protein
MQVIVGVGVEVENANEMSNGRANRSSAKASLIYAMKVMGL